MQMRTDTTAHWKIQKMTEEYQNNIKCHLLYNNRSIDPPFYVSTSNLTNLIVKVGGVGWG